MMRGIRWVLRSNPINSLKKTKWSDNVHLLLAIDSRVITPCLMLSLEALWMMPLLDQTNQSSLMTCYEEADDKRSESSSFSLLQESWDFSTQGWHPSWQGGRSADITKKERKSNNSHKISIIRSDCSNVHNNYGSLFITTMDCWRGGSLHTNLII